VGISPIGIITDTSAGEPRELGGVGFQALRANVLFGLEAPSSIAVVAPTTGSGTHTIGHGLAQSLASTSRRVGLIDLRPEASSTTSDPTADNEESVVRIPADRITSLRQTREALTELAEEFDHVIVLCPAATVDTAAAEVAAQCASTLLVVRVDHTTTSEVDITARILVQTSTPIGGVVVNAVPAGQLSEWARLIPRASEPAGAASPQV
jgi:Mrp family chromosome partitioning ATPase